MMLKWMAFPMDLNPFLVVCDAPVQKIGCDVRFEMTRKARSVSKNVFF